MCDLILLVLEGTGREGEGPISLRDYESADSVGCDLAMGRRVGGLFWVIKNNKPFQNLEH